MGYVSFDFKDHPVGLFLNNILKYHNRQRVEITCYNNNIRGDHLTDQLKQDADRWRDIFSLSDQAAIALMRQDSIDILVDLSGHTAGNRLSMFAQRSAPVQLSWLGYFGTTGLAEMDYILGGNVMDGSPRNHHAW